MRTMPSAARAGLAVIDAVGRLATPEPLNVRIGIASGLVVVGDLIGAGAAQERHRQLAPLRLGCGVRRGTLPARPPPRRARHRPQGLRSLSAAAGDGRSRRRQVLSDRRPSAPAGRAGRSRSRGMLARSAPARAPAASPQCPFWSFRRSPSAIVCAKAKAREPMMRPKQVGIVKDAAQQGVERRRHPKTALGFCLGRSRH